MIFIVLFSVLGTPKVYAGNPLYMASQDTPLVWDTSKTIKYKVDPKGLGKLSFEQSLALVQEAFSIWESVSDTGIEFEYIGTEEEEITIDNWESIAGNHIYAEANPTNTDLTTNSQRDNYIVIGFDNTGEILEAKGSEGASGAQSLTGIKGSYNNPEYIISSHLFINGLYYNDQSDAVQDLELIDLFAIIVHELGHVIGLDHTLSHYQMYQDILSGTIDTHYARYLPTMFPRFIRGTGAHLISLHPDDIATLQWMYGAEIENSISGEVTDANGTPMDTLVVSIRNNESPLCETYSQATSIICSNSSTTANNGTSSHFNIQNCLDDDDLGIYIIPLLNSGDYTVDVQEIPELFATSIARFDSSLADIQGRAEFYNENDMSNEDNDNYSFVRINSSNIQNIDITLASRTAIDASLDRISYTYFEENSNFHMADDDDMYCPLEGSLNNKALVSLIDEIDISASLNSTDETTNLSSCSLKTKATPQNYTLFLILLSLLLIFVPLQRRRKLIEESPKTM